MKNDKLRNELEQFSSHHVRSLYWLLFSPCPIKMGGVEGVALFPETWIEELKVSSVDYFKQLDRNPESLVFFLAQGNIYRLGMYAERLLCFFFDTFAEIELLLHNFQIIDHKITLGEVDFVIRWHQRTIHIELATKYYLSKKWSPDFNQWIGPSGRDSLDRKMKKVKELQLPITDSQVFKSQTKLESVDSYLLLRGHFFTNDIYMPLWKNPNASYGKYSYLKDFTPKYKGAPSRYFFLWKPNWMASVAGVLLNEENIKKKHYVVSEILEKEEHFLVLDLKTKTPLFVVKDSWPN